MKLQKCKILNGEGGKGLPKSLTFNGIRKPWLYLLEGRQKAPFAPITRNLLRIPGRPGALLQSSETEPLTIYQPIGFVVRDDIHELQIKDELASWLVTEKEVELQFDDEPGRTYYAVVQNTIEDLYRFANLRRGVIQFLVLDGYGYGPEQVVPFTSDIMTLTNNGTAEADPIFELTVKKPVTFAMIQNQDNEYMMIGGEPTVEQTIINPKTQILNEDGSNLSTWTPATNVDGGTVRGTFGTDGSGITVSSYGQHTDNWYGPSIIKEVPVTQDFEVEAYLQGRTPTRMHTFRVELYLLDEAKNVLGKIAVLDNTRANTKVIAEGRVGPINGGHYVISGSNYSHNWDYFYGLMRIRREGKTFNFYVSRRDVHGRHIDSISQSFTDNGNKYGGRLKYVQIHIGKHGDTTPSAKFFSVKAYSLRQPTEKQSPFIADVGDIITLDHVNDDILINGENRADLKQFGASFFKLKKGQNILVVAPDDSFDVRCKYRERYR